MLASGDLDTRITIIVRRRTADFFSDGTFSFTELSGFQARLDKELAEHRDHGSWVPRLPASLAGTYTQLGTRVDLQINGVGNRVAYTTADGSLIRGHVLDELPDGLGRLRLRVLDLTFVEIDPSLGVLCAGDPVPGT